MISLPEAVETVIYAFKEMVGSRIFVRQIPSINIPELAKTIGPDCSLKEIGLRPGEKLHEQLISADKGLLSLTSSVSIIDIVTLKWMERV